MRVKRKIITIFALVCAVSLIAFAYLHTQNVAVFNSAGEIGRKERNLMYFALALSAIVVVPVYTLTIFIAVRYREDNKKAKYSPEFDGSRALEFTWWAIPMTIIGILCVVTWNSSHALDPYKPINATSEPITVQVVALDWKWLFIYPDQQVASVNRVEFPLNTPVDLFITSDTVMNSFWVPNLSGQIYAMPGMSTQLHLIADKPGKYYGSSANISGKGFAGMNFEAYAVSQQSYNTWMSSLKKYPVHLTFNAYDKLAKPSEDNPVAYYSDVSKGLYSSVIEKYMMPQGTSASMAMKGAY